MVQHFFGMPASNSLFIKCNYLDDFCVIFYPMFSFLSNTFAEFVLLYVFTLYSSFFCKEFYFLDLIAYLRFLC